MSYAPDGSTTQRFMAALQTAENTRQLDDLLALHAPEVTLRNLSAHSWSGLDGAREFWQTYLNNFAQVHSEFARSHEEGGLGVMEWETTGQLAAGRDVAYRGVSLIDVRDGRVTAFRTYYDSAAFVAPATE
ncbi:nuclear transport factor 2 family protein [Deinococcus arcticus]|uniref:Epoxide hydrolase n=1 Tax=Deinococcus arcticus TaxID=2136176 RepID=A0A2T3W893_9DEIO|nr:nuclear transport factor 2 family protein [Deinococcus arcticus]PTA67963.1 epoxide hydrolase [Deinococcus arcticus]